MPAKVDAATEAVVNCTSRELTVQTTPAPPGRSYLKNMDPSENNTKANTALEKEGSAFELYPRLDIVGDLDCDELTEEVTVPGVEPFSKKKIPTCGQQDKQKIVPGGLTRPIRGSDKRNNVLMREEVSNTDRLLVLCENTRRVVYARENRKQSPFRAWKSRSTYSSRADRRKRYNQPS